MALVVTPLTSVTRGADRFCVVDSAGVIVSEITGADYAALGARRLRGQPIKVPPGLTQSQWLSGNFCAGRWPDYGNGLLGVLRHGEISEQADRFEMGVRIQLGRFAGRLTKARIFKTRVNVVRTGGLTITRSRADAWSDALAIVSIESGILTVDGV